MPFTPQEIESKQFAVGLRGYDQQEVSAFLRTVASDYQDLLEHGTNGRAVVAAGGDAYAAMGDEVAAVLRSARDAATEVRRHADEEAEALLTKAREEAAELESTASRHLEEADASAADTRSRADAEADGIVEKARQDAQQLLADAVARYEQLIRDEQTLGRRLRGVRDDVQDALARIPPPEATGVDISEPEPAAPEPTSPAAAEPTSPAAAEATAPAGAEPTFAPDGD